MHAHEIFAAIPPELALEILAAADTYDKPLYRELLAELAKVRRTRPVAIQRSPRSERHPWLIAMLSQPPATTLAFRCIANWLLETQQPMLVQFLDDLGVRHDGQGTVDDVPAEPPAQQVSRAVERLLAAHSPLHVAIYLHSFVAMSADWQALAGILRDSPELQIPSGPASQGG